MNSANTEGGTRTMARPTSLTRAAAIFALALGLGAAAATAATLINAAGASFPYPMYSKLFDQYNKLHPDIQINYQSVGSGSGIQQVTAGTVAFGASDGPMTDTQLKAFEDKHHFPVLHFPTVLGAAAPAHTDPGLPATLHFTPPP